jgi:hypothetical protein
MSLVTQLVWVISDYVSIEGTVHKKAPEQIEFAFLEYISNAVSYGKV